MKLLSTRRLTGPNRWTMRPAALGEIELDLPQDQEHLDAWCAQYQRCVQVAAEAIGWPGCEAFAVPDGCYLMVGLYAPLDGLYVGCDLVEWAVDALLDAEKTDKGGGVEDAGATALPTLPEATKEGFVRMVQREHNPHLLAMYEAAQQREIPFLQDDDHVSLGLGQHAQVWKANALPPPEALDALPWETYKPIQVAMLTGTNGKTTTARMLAKIAQVAGILAGNTSTDGLAIDGELVESGDWTGPGGARHILRHADLSLAVLETARGGLLRRGLACQWADVAAVTNVSDDHLGEWGIETVDQMAEVKLLIRHGLRPKRPLILNADCPVSLAASAQILTTEELAQTSWCTRAPQLQDAKARIPGGRVDAWCQDDALFFRRPGYGSPVDTRDAQEPLSLPLHELPSSLGGTAQHNVANAQVAALAALALGIESKHVIAGLRAFRPSVADSPGRANVFQWQGAHIIVDFGHNPAGVAAIAAMAAAQESTGRCLVLLGQAGDRSDAEIQGLATAAMAARPDQILLKEMLPYLRGRRAWEIPELLRETFAEAGIAPHQITTTKSERDAVTWALSWARPGDLLLLFIQADIKGTLAHLQSIGATEGWS